MTERTSASGELVLVATPIGNLGDLSARALQLLATAAVVYCEDTRHSRTLFSANGIDSAGRLLALHEHNEVAQSAEVVERVARGETVVLISDAGTPGISDPGSRVVAAVIAAGGRVTTAPGPSAVIAALSISGLDTERFIMEGFVPRKAGERDAWFRAWLHETRTVVFYESPQRVTATLTAMAEVLGERRVAVARELTKLHEEVLRGTVTEVAAALRAREVLGEIVVVLEGATTRETATSEDVDQALREQLAQGLSTRDAVAYVAEILEVAHREVYQRALALKRGDGAVH